MHEGSAKAWLPSKGVAPLLKATVPTCVLRRRGLSLHQHAPRSSPYDTGAGSHASCELAQDRRNQTAARGARNCPAVTSAPPSSPKPAGERAGRHAGGMQLHQGDAPFLTSTRPAWRPRPTRHVTGTPVTTCEKLHRHLRQYRVFSTTEPVPRLEATRRMAQQCQPSTSVTDQSAAGEGATIDMARSGPTVMATAGERKRQSNRLQAHVPSWSSRRALSHGVKTTRPCSVPRTARARTTAAPRTTRPIALTLWQGRRHLWQAKRATLHLRHDDRVKKGVPRRSISYPFPLPLSLSCYRDREGDTPKGILLREQSGPRAPLLIRGSKAGPRKGSTAASEHSGSAPLLVRGSKAGPSEGFDSRLRPLGLRAHY
jgi:hypothetical protein